jgi:hypothetical protein
MCNQKKYITNKSELARTVMMSRTDLRLSATPKFCMHGLIKGASCCTRIFLHLALAVTCDNPNRPISSSDLL